MKKLISLVMALVLLASVPVYGDSFFPKVPSKAQAEYAPSYGAYVGINPDFEFTEEGILYRGYKNVTTEDFEQYGSYLQKMGYTYTEDDCTYDYDLGGMTIELTNGSMAFWITYFWEDENLGEGYPEGVMLEPVNAGNPAASIQPERNTVAETTCKYCGGTGTCDYCVNGECQDCFGEGSVFCDYCLGGNCRRCDGQGGELKYVFGGDNRWVECSSCGGSGNCSRCGGTGEKKCTTCNGSGNCRYCGGTGDCSYCS